MHIASTLESLQQEDNLRIIPKLQYNGIYVRKNNKNLLNLASNDYLGLQLDSALREVFLSSLNESEILFSSSSSRILSGNFEVYEKFEGHLSQIYAPKQALLFNSGYHLNISCMQALGQIPDVLFLLDEFIHASVIDGVRLSRAHFKRFRHNDMGDLEDLLKRYAPKHQHIVIVSEGVFSMEGDMARLSEIITLKRIYPNVMIYLDEAHSIGVIGDDGLGVAKTLGLLEAVDFLVLTFGKALSSVGACMLCASEFKLFFINFARGLIYSTSLPPINVAFSYFIFTQLESFKHKRTHLKELSLYLINNLKKLGFTTLGECYIISIICGSNKDTLLVSQKLENGGIFAPAIRYPTIPKNTARIRFSLHSGLDRGHLDMILGVLNEG